MAGGFFTTEPSGKIFKFFKKKKTHIYSFIFIYLALLGLNCGMWDLWLLHVGSRSLAKDGTQAPCIQHTES